MGVIVEDRAKRLEREANRYRKMAMAYATGNAPLQKRKKPKSKPERVSLNDHPVAEDFAKRFAAENRLRTRAEVEMAEILHGTLDPFSIKFAEQTPIDRYIADFYIPSKRLVFEVDGEYHFYRDKYDNRRTKRLRKLGYHVVRFTNHEVLTNPFAVSNRVRKLCIGEHEILIR